MTLQRQALYYPFHLCSKETWECLTRHFQTIHFRDYMAVQLTPFFGTTAFGDRMGDHYPDSLAEGRLVQGHNVSGLLDAAMEAAVNRDLADPAWRHSFHEAFKAQRRFQRGLFDPSHGMVIGGRLVPGPMAMLSFMEDGRADESYTVDTVRRLSRTRIHALNEGYRFEYGVALIKTAASGIWTQRIAIEHNLSVATDSAGHFALLEQSCARDGIELVNYLLRKDGVLEAAPRPRRDDETITRS